MHRSTSCFPSSSRGASHWPQLYTSIDISWGHLTSATNLRVRIHYSFAIWTDHLYIEDAATSFRLVLCQIELWFDCIMFILLKYLGEPKVVLCKSSKTLNIKFVVKFFFLIILYNLIIFHHNCFCFEISFIGTHALIIFVFFLIFNYLSLTSHPCIRYWLVSIFDCLGILLLLRHNRKLATWRLK